MKVTINGEAQEIRQGVTLAELISLKGLDDVACAVEVNRELAPRQKRARRVISPGDAIEIVTLVGGG